MLTSVLVNEYVAICVRPENIATVSPTTGAVAPEPFRSTRITGAVTLVILSVTLLPESEIKLRVGAAGGVEAVFSVLAIRDNIAPPTLNLDNPIETSIYIVGSKAEEKKMDIVASNSFGFGGTNASLIFRRYVG